MKYLVATAFFFLTVSCESFVMADRRPQCRLTLEQIKRSIRNTVAVHVELCGDTICEGDTEPEAVIAATGQVIIYDLEELCGE